MWIKTTDGNYLNANAAKSIRWVELRGNVELKMDSESLLAIENCKRNDTKFAEVDGKLQKALEKGDLLVIAKIVPLDNTTWDKIPNAH